MNVTLGDGVLEVALPGGRHAQLHVRALRDGCPCADCRHPVSGQRLFETLEVVPQARAVAVETAEDGLRVEWSDGHVSDYDADWLERRLPQDPELVLWDAHLEPPVVRYEDVLDDPAAKARWLAAVARYGFAVLRGAPTSPGTVASVAELFGHVRVTNYGRIFDVEVRVDATNLANTSLGLSLHTDNPYREPVPTLQLLHCLASDVAGGETVLADGFRAVELLRSHDPSLLDVLGERPIRYAYRDGGADLRADVPVVVLDGAGDPVALHVNNRSKDIPTGTADDVADWYDAYLDLLAILHAPDARVVFRLEPGDVLTFDNLRVLHGRTSFESTGTRRLQGCYADRDGLLSTLRLLEAA